MRQWLAVFGLLQGLGWRAQALYATAEWLCLFSKLLTYWYLLCWRSTCPDETEISDQPQHISLVGSWTAESPPQSNSYWWGSLVWAPLSLPLYCCGSKNVHIMLNFMCVHESLWSVPIDTEEESLFVFVCVCYFLWCVQIYWDVLSCGNQLLTAIRLMKERAPPRIINVTQTLTLRQENTTWMQTEKKKKETSHTVKDAHSSSPSSALSVSFESQISVWALKRNTYMTFENAGRVYMYVRQCAHIQSPVTLDAFWSFSVA